ncbi:L-serine ammonia-lyase [Paenirhodobacter populi]|uniref:L-serine dehydratase n=1 Tax=Paenirhodobacter populi TaxID=2306993 RepID=A0A443JVC2_9RHOB|nr:L-serine ammonia-lyase [Sinirhodobacter populi]RWR24472.1 L-serine ammonia-lyase [Sinirhodobacter populi]
MFLSVFDIFKVGVGPSSSHTMGPMVAGARFLAALRGSPFRAAGLRARLHGSLAFTGKGHATDRATILGLAGFAPDTYDAEAAEAALAANRETKVLTPPGLGALAFDPERDLIFDYGPPLPLHANGMVIEALDAQGDVVLQETYYSIGGGFVRTAAELASVDDKALSGAGPVPFPFRTAGEMLAMARESGLSIAQMKRRNERVFRKDAEIDAGLARIWAVMDDCLTRGLTTDGILPGGLQVKRRAKAIHESLLAERGMNLAPPHTINDWVSAYAMAVNEENAAGGQVVTAPTNGAAGVVPAVIRYWLDHVPGASSARVGEFLLTAAAVGGLIKTNASISGAECGCQAEVGSAAAMAAAGIAAVLGGSPEQIENAAEIALEHHLGMTCDPVKGLVQVPCIERNGLGAIKAISAASLSLRGDGTHFVPLDAAIETMRQTGRDMDHRYKETSLGGLAVNVPNC